MGCVPCLALVLNWQCGSGALGCRVSVTCVYDLCQMKSRDRLADRISQSVWWAELIVRHSSEENWKRRA